jgi:hypothetical protein
MPAVLCKLKTLAAHLAILEIRIMADSATSLLPISHLPTRAKKSNFPHQPLLLTIDYQRQK